MVDGSAGFGPKRNAKKGFGLRNFSPNCGLVLILAEFRRQIAKFRCARKHDLHSWHAAALKVKTRSFATSTTHIYMHKHSGGLFWLKRPHPPSLTIWPEPQKHSQKEKLHQRTWFLFTASAGLFYLFNANQNQNSPKNFMQPETPSESAGGQSRQSALTASSNCNRRRVQTGFKSVQTSVAASVSSLSHLERGLQDFTGNFWHVYDFDAGRTSWPHFSIL